jgi:hypothetical protein
VEAVSLTTDPKDPRLGHGVDTGPVPQHEVYLVLSEEERAKGFKRPVLRSYRHVGIPGPRWPLRDLTEEERERYSGTGYVKFESYPEDAEPAFGRFWTQGDLDKVGVGCGTVTTMGQALAETYARNPHFYGATYCCTCQRHLAVGERGEFTWMDQHGRPTEERVGT